MKFVAAFRDVGGVGGIEVEEGFEAGADEGEDGFLAEGSGSVGGLEALVECAAECPAGGGGRDDEVLGVVRAGQTVGGRWWEAGGRWCWLEIGCVVSICPGFGWSASLKEKRVRINEEIPIRVIDEESSAFFLGQAVGHPQAQQCLSKPSISRLHHIREASPAHIPAVSTSHGFEVLAHRILLLLTALGLRSPPRMLAW